eukprot:2293185-Prymnesium_polylepis.2
MDRRGKGRSHIGRLRTAIQVTACSKCRLTEAQKHRTRTTVRYRRERTRGGRPGRLGGGLFAERHHLVAATARLAALVATDTRDALHTRANTRSLSAGAARVERECAPAWLRRASPDERHPGQARPCLVSPRQAPPCPVSPPPAAASSIRRSRPVDP